jgi:glycosyltransferase involved in cell wall biosynthesis
VRVLINAVSIKEGGSRVVLTRLLSAMMDARPDIEWIVAAHPKCIPVKGEHSSVSWLSAPEVEGSALGVFTWYEIALPAMVQKYRPVVLFSQTNYLPRRPLGCARMLLIQHAGHFSTEFDRLTRASLSTRWARLSWRQKRRWVHRSAQMAELLTVQTAALAEKISAQAGRPREQIAVIPHGPGMAAHRPSPRLERRPQTFRIGYVTKWGVQKNFATLFEAARKLSNAGYGFKIILTLDPRLQPVNQIMTAARSLGIDALIENHGEVPQEDVSRIYDDLDIFVFASLCESFGFPIVEAMARGLPLVVAKTSENTEVARGAALEFAPRDSETLARHLAAMMDDGQERALRAERSLAASRTFSWEKAARETLAALDSLAGVA